MYVKSRRSSPISPQGSVVPTMRPKLQPHMFSFDGRGSWNTDTPTSKEASVGSSHFGSSHRSIKLALEIFCLFCLMVA